MIRSCLDLQDEDEEFFSASDGENRPPPPPRECKSSLDNNRGNRGGSYTSTGAAAIADRTTADDATNAVDGRQGSVVDSRPLSSLRVGRTAAGGSEMHDVIANDQGSPRVLETITMEPGPYAFPATESSQCTSNGIDNGVLGDVTRRHGHETRRQLGTEPGSIGQSRSSIATKEGMLGEVGGKARQAAALMRAGGVSAAASFAAISVSDLRLGIYEDLDWKDRRCFVRVRDQHGNQKQTSTRAFPMPKSFQQDEGSKNSQSRTTWCQELKMPIAPDVEGVLFELLLVAASSGSSDRRSTSPPSNVEGSVGSIGSRGRSTPDPLYGRGAGNTSGHPNREQDAASDVLGTEAASARSKGEKPSTDKNFCLEGGRKRDSRAGVLVGAVALLLSEIANAWRTMESPLFDYAGSVIGRIKLAARLSGVEIRDTRVSDEVQSIMESEAAFGSVRGTSTAQTKCVHTAGVLDQVAKVALSTASLEKPVRPVPSTLSMEQEAESSPDHVVEPIRAGCGRQHRMVYAAESRCHRRRRESCCSVDGACSSRGSAQRNDEFHQGGLPGNVESAAVAAKKSEDKGGCSSVVKAEESTPRVDILYRGVRLPFRWFRSGTAGGMEEALRATLGKCILVDSIPLPLLYDINTGERVILQPGIPTGRTFLATLEGRSSSAKQSLSGGTAVEGKIEGTSTYRGRQRVPFARETGLFNFRRQCRCRRRERRGSIDRCSQSVSPRTHLDRGAELNTFSPRRVASTGNLCNPSLATAAERRRSNSGTQARAEVSSSTAQVTSSTACAATVALGRTGDFAQAMERRQPQPRREREGDELREAHRRGEGSQIDAKAVAYQLACRVACRGLRTRLLTAAMWRWKAQAMNLKLELSRREEQRKNDEQAVAFLEKLRQDVEALTASTNEGLLEVSIDALERDFVTGEATTPWKEADESFIGIANGEKEKDIVGRGVAELRAGIARLSKLQAEKTECQRARIREAHNIKGAVARNSDGYTTPAAGFETGAFETETKDCATPKPLNRGDTECSGANICGNEQESHHYAPTPSDWQGKSSCLHEDDIDGTNIDGAGLATTHNTRDEHRSTQDLLSSGEAKYETGATRDGNYGNFPQEVSPCGQGKIWGADDEILEGFLTRCAAETCSQREAEHLRHYFGTSGRNPDKTRAETANGVVRSEWGLKLLWALFRVFSDSSSPPCANPHPRPRPISANRQAVGVDSACPRRLGTHPEAVGLRAQDEAGHDGASQEGMSLPAFLRVCRMAGLTLPTMRGAASFNYTDGLERDVPGDPFGRAGHWCGCGGGRAGCCLGAGGRGCTVEEAMGVTESTASLEKYFLLDPADAASVFARVVRRYGSVTGIAEHRTDRCPPDSEKNDQFSACDRVHLNGGDCRTIPSFCGRRRPPAMTTAKSDAHSETGKDAAAFHGGRNVPVCRRRDNCGVQPPQRYRSYITDDEGSRLYHGANTSFDRYQRRHPPQQHSDQENRRANRTPRRRQDRCPSGSDRGGLLGCMPLSSDKRLLDFEQFVAAVEGVVELLTVGSDERGHGLSGDAGGKIVDDAGVIVQGANIRAGAEGGRGDAHGALRYDDSMRTPRVMTMTPELAQARMARLAKEVAVEQLVMKDRQATEILALLDPSLQSALDINREVLHEVFTFYSHKHARRQNSACTNRAHPHNCDNDADAIGIATQVGWIFDGGGNAWSDGYIAAARGGGHSGGKTSRGPQATVRCMNVEGGRAFAADFGLMSLVADPQQLGELWTVACLHQPGQRHDRRELAQQPGVEEAGSRYQAEQEEEAGDGPPDSNMLLFSGFLDFLGRFALRHAQPSEESDVRVMQQGAASLLKGPTKSQDTSNPDSSMEQRPGQPMLALLSLMNASGGCRKVASGSGPEGCAGGSSMRMLRRGFRLPLYEQRKQCGLGRIHRAFRSGSLPANAVTFGVSRAPLEPTA